MISGNFRSVSIDAITVLRDQRQRRELVNIDELAASIREVGLINPPVVTDELVLVAGERRLTACRSLGWTAIPVQFASTLDTTELHLIELEENVKRVDLSWQDQCAAVLEYHRLRTLQEGWTASQTAEQLGVSPATVTNQIMVAEELAKGNLRVAEADKYSVALGVVKRDRERAAASAFDKLAVAATRVDIGEPAESIEVGEVDLSTSEADAANLARIIAPFSHKDFREFVVDYAGPKYNFIHCDFPYGVNAQSHAQGAGQAFGTYADSADVYWELLDTLAEAMQDVVSPSAHMMFWFSMDYYHETKVRLESMGWRVNPFPLIWHKSDNSGILPDPKRGPRRIYETAFLCSRGDRLIVQAISNVASFPNTKEIHMSEKNPQMLAHFFRMFVDKHTVMLDPTMGSGNAVIVAEEMGADYVLGLERDEEFYTRAVERYVAKEK